ncbi:uncharacterized protein LOC111615311 isoform X2 [Centruroides sculpturatus]|uniref:uncharacterized protein LOC111615311 isoform X2 n=1 Tax=Centruroides sculpturatus TaxID=218467 RepID=UPI000C6E0337|nr:uncharacterized protein LOC111615311 isoform X2 [Centruroides sculpturatus]
MRRENQLFFHIVAGDFSWTGSSTQLLITTRLNMDDEFRKPIRKTKLQDSISKKIESHGYTVSPSDCDKKWRNLKTTYKRNRDKAKQHTGKSAITWPYFKLLNLDLEWTSILQKKVSFLLSHAWSRSHLPANLQAVCQDCLPTMNLMWQQYIPLQ